MAIITLTEYKTFPCYNSTQTDAIINSLIPSVEADFKRIRNKAFYKVEGDVTNGSPIITNCDNITGLEDGMFGYNSNITGTIIDVSTTAYEFTLSANATGTATDEDIIIYPAGSKRIVAYMLNFQIENFAGVTTETIASHSADYGELMQGYPLALVRGIIRYL